MRAGLADLVRRQNDQSLSSLESPRSYSYHSDSESDLRNDIETYGPRRPLPKNALQLQDPSLKCDRNLGWNIDWAVAFIIDYLETKSTDAAEALRDIRIRASTLEREGPFEEIPYRIFSKLAAVLFAGHLKNAVFLDIRNLNTDVSGATFTHGWGPNNNVKRVSIILNSKALKCSFARDIVAILIHHMIHAYFLITCGPQKEEEAAYGRLAHGLHFAKVMLAIKKISAAHGKPLTPLNFGHDSVGADSFLDDVPYPGGITFIEREKEDKKKWYCSHCHQYVEPIPESAVDKWYSKACKPMFDLPSCVRKAEVTFYNDRRHELETQPRARLLPSDKSLEFVFKNKPVLVDSKKANLLLGVRRAFEKANCRFLEVHRSVSERTFLRFLEFLHTGCYRPDIASYAAIAAGLGMGRNGPPIIRPPGSTTEAFLLADIQFSKLGNSMGFEDCKAYAMDRMNAYGVLSEDPVAILREIYDGREPDADLKHWARKFLVQAPVPLFSEVSSPSFMHSTTEPPNLIKLESEQGSYRARFFDAIDRSGALENDVNKARAELKAMGWYPWSSLNLLPATNLAPRYTSSPLSLSIVHPPPFAISDARATSLNPAWLAPPGFPAAAHNLHSLPSSSSSSSLTSPSAYALQRQRDRDAKDLFDFEREMRRDVERMKILSLEKERAREMEMEREMEREMARAVEGEKERIRKLERERVRREKAQVEFEREREREKREMERARGEEALKRFYRGVGKGFVESESEGERW